MSSSDKLFSWLVIVLIIGGLGIMRAAVDNEVAHHLSDHVVQCEKLHTQQDRTACLGVRP